MTKQQPIDQAQRDRALSTQHSFAVSAPAGSGKTGLLTQRVLGLLALCDEPENVLAITFTKKAAAEMQARILDALRHAQEHTTEPEADYLKATWHLARAVLARNTEKEWELFSCPNRLRITTIDSLCRSISQQMPFESKLGHTPEILDNPNLAYEIAARETLQHLNTSNDLQAHLIRLVKHFDNKLDRIEALLMQLLAKRDQWLNIIFQSKDQRRLLELMLVEVIEEHLLNSQDILAPISSELAILADHAASQLAQSSSPIQSCLGLMDTPPASADAMTQWLGLVELLLTQKGELRKSATKAIGFLAPSDKSLSKEQQAEAKIKKQHVAELLEVCKTLPDLESTLHSIRTLPAPHYKESQWELLDSLTHVLVNLAQNLTLAFQQLGKTDYLALTLAALDALGEPDEPSDLALALDYKIQHILVDEFQDTSTTQLELLQRLTAGWQSDDGRTLFIVGDAMQSCYRFRDANVGIFLNARAQGIGDIDLEPLDLKVNFRSQQGIVDWVNQSFTDIFPSHDDSNRGAVSYNPSASFNAPLDCPAVQSHLLAYTDIIPSPRKEEASSVVHIVQQSQQERPEDSIAILVRGKAHAQDIIVALGEADIHYQATDIDRLDTCMPVLDCLSLTKALLYPNDRMAWLAILRAPWCGLDMNDLLAVATHHKSDKSWPLLINNIAKQDIPLSASGKKKLYRFSTLIHQALKQQKRYSLRYWIQGLWLSLGGPALLINVGDNENINTFFNLLDHYEQGGTIPLWQDLEKAVNELYAKPKKDEGLSIPAVQIMTIHKSKGLEFDTVIIPSLEKKPRANDKELITWLERVAYSPQTQQQERQLLISPVNATGDDKDPIYHFIQQQHNDKEQLESNRLLYVGCTRAIKQLHLMAYLGINTSSENTSNKLNVENLKEPSKQSLLSRLWPSINNSDDAHRHITLCDAPNNEDQHARHKKLSHPNAIVSLHEDWQAPTITANTLLENYRGNNQLALMKVSKGNIQTDLFAQAPDSPEVNTQQERENIATPDALLQREQRYIGTVIHLALQHITHTGYQHWTHSRILQQQPIWKAQLQQKGISPPSLNKALDAVELAINNTLNDPTGQWLLNNQHISSECELELWDSKGQHIIDRTFIEKNNNDTSNGTSNTIRWIIDYKNSQPSEDQSIEAFTKEQIQLYKGQLERYKKLFKDEGSTIKAALYFPSIPLLCLV